MKKLLAFSSLLIVFACAAFNYSFYGVNTADVPASTLREIELVAGQKKDRDRTMDMCKLDKGDVMAKCILVPIDEFRVMRQEIVDCRAEKK